jgi:hypothetical protein
VLRLRLRRERRHGLFERLEQQRVEQRLVERFEQRIEQR